MNFSIADIAKVTGANLVGNQLLADSNAVNDIAFDTRKLWANGVEGTLFVAIKGDRNGHDFINAAYLFGVRIFLVSRTENFWENQCDGALFLVVEDTLIALQLWASWHRNKITGVVVGITGSNGKTIVKEWLGELLEGDFILGKSPRSFNSQLGVALSLLNMDVNTAVALVEVGISSQGDMRSLTKMAKPNMVILTHLGDAHSSGFESIEQKAVEKMSLAKYADVVVYPFDIQAYKQGLGTLKSKQPMTKMVHWGRQDGAQLRVIGIEAMVGNVGQAISFVHRGTEHRLEIPFMDSAAVSNAMTCLCALIALERWDAEHLLRFKKLSRLENRLLMTQGKRGNYLLNDSYSADVESLGVALDMLKRQSPNLPMVAILGEFDQSGMSAVELFGRISGLLQSYGVEQLLGVGISYGSKMAKAAFEGLKFEHVQNTEALLLMGELWDWENKAILVKGARRMGMERVVERLQERLHQTRLEINLNALKCNYLQFRKSISPGVKTMCMVKAFGYGSGSFESARALQALGVDYLGVAYTDEGVSLRKSGITVPIMVMNAEAGSAWILKEYRLEPVVFSKESLLGFASAGVNDLSIHLEIDTGMHRLGFSSSELNDALHGVPTNLKIVSVFSHLAASEDSGSDEFTQSQMVHFLAMAEKVESVLGYTVLKHIQNTGGILRFDSNNFSMVRLGIGLYGIDPRRENINNSAAIKLQPVMRWITSISQIQHVKAGEGIGYGMRDAVNRNREIAVIAAGYADGLSRLDGQGKSSVWILGKECFFVGNICMDMAMVDVTGLASKAGDEVEIFGSNLSVETIAERRGTIPYEVLTSVSQRVNRVYVEE